MSTNREKLRSVRHLPDVIKALLRSKKNRITSAWKLELYYALRHYPFLIDEITVNGYKDDHLTYSSPEELDERIEQFTKWVDCQPTKSKKKK